MKDSTLKILTAALKADETVTSGQRSKILKLARGEEPQSTPAQYGNGHEPRIYSREETAKILGNKSQRYVDLLCKRGLLQKFIPKGIDGPSVFIPSLLWLLLRNNGADTLRSECISAR